MRRAAAAAALLLPLLVACSGEDGDAGRPTVTAPTSEPTAPSEPTEGTTDGRSGRPGRDSPGPVRVVDTVATGLQAPWGLDFLPDGRAVVTERDTRRVLLVDAEGGEPRPVAVIEQAE